MVLRIYELPTDIANQIAAGEVIERPASVVKELLENARDADASAIHIDIEFGGLNLISISDNGVGIHADDLPLAVTAHATSKIKTLNDLYAIHTMGFRGEALASIASVARLTIQSRTEEAEQASELAWQQQRWQLSPCARQRGTTVVVRDLFYNAPVRKRFLKSERTEFLAVESVVKRFALSTPKTAIVLCHNDKIVLNLPAAKDEKRLLIRLEKLFGKGFMQAAKYINAERAGMRLEGWFSDETYQRSQSDKQWVYVNQRMVKDKLLNHAVKQAYESVMYPGRHPACLLYLTIDPSEVDVNVHPTKHELRFQQPRLVHDFMYSQLSQQLGKGVSKTEHKQTDRLPESHPSMVKSRWQVAEPVLRTDFLATTGNLNIDKVPFQFLTSDYGMMPWQNHWLLWHKPALLERAFLWHFNQQPLPLPSRPLLVPIDHSLTEEQQIAIEPYLCLLKRVGLDVQINANKLQWRGTPIALPQLPLDSLVKSILDQKPKNEHALIVILVIENIKQAMPMDATIQDLVMAFCEAHQRDIEQDRIEGIIRLTDHHCRSIVYG